MNEKQYSSHAAYDDDLKTVNEVYLAAVPWFEKAHEIKPEDVDTLEFLKSLCFRLRDEPGIMTNTTPTTPSTSRPRVSNSRFEIQ